MNDPQRPGFLGALGRFFFSPTDPSTLGFMRLITGLILLYVHGVGYTLDLQELLGPNAWWDQRQATPNVGKRHTSHRPWDGLTSSRLYTSMMFRIDVALRSSFSAACRASRRSAL